MSDMNFDGRQFTWKIGGRTKYYKGTSGVPGFQNSKFETVSNRGPIPTGTYRVPVFLNGSAEDDGTKTCRLVPGWGIQDVPGTGSSVSRAGADCWDNYWAAWGPKRLQIARKEGAYNAAPNRSGFYIHDSAKGASQGCIEIESVFFDDLKNWITSERITRHNLELSVKYPNSNHITNGNTGKKWTLDQEAEYQIRIHGG